MFIVTASFTSSAKQKETGSERNMTNGYKAISTVLILMI